MTLTFQINYRTPYGQSICVIETEQSVLGWTEEHPLQLNCQGQDFWTATLPVSDFVGTISYKYAIRLPEGGYLYEAGMPRHLTLRNADKKLVVRDFWQAQDYEKAFYTTAFLKSRPHFTRQDVAPLASTAAKPARSVWSAGRWKPVKSRLYSIAET